MESHYIDRALHNVVRAKAYSLIKSIVEAGADINAYDETGLGLIHHAALQGDITLFRILIENGANIALPTQYGQKTVVHQASRSNSENREKFLVFFDTQVFVHPLSSKKLLKAFDKAFDIKTKQTKTFDPLRIETIKQGITALTGTAADLSEASQLGILDQALNDDEVASILSAIKIIHALFEEKPIIGDSSCVDFSGLNY